MRWLPLLVLLTACGDPPFEPRSKVLGYRVLAIRADLPEARPDQRVNVRAFEHVPDDATVERAWSFCAYSFGGFYDYDCVDAALEIPLEGSEGEVVVDLPQILGRLAMGEPVAGIDRMGGALDLNQKGLEAYVRLKSRAAWTDDGEARAAELETVFRILIRTREPANTNPGLQGIRFPHLSGVGESAPATTTIELEVVPEEDARETFDALDNRCFANALEGASDDPVTRTAAYEGCLEPAQEDLIYQWFSTDGEFSNPIAVNDDTQTVLSLPETPGPLVIWVVMRDGRGGVAIAEHTLMVTER